MVFVDTSAIYAFLASDDVGHAASVAAWKRFMDEATPLFTSNYVVVESCALLQGRLGMGAVRINFAIDILRDAAIACNAETCASVSWICVRTI